MLNVDERAVVSQADLIYQSPVEQPVEGQPIGNGRMGTLVWTTPTQLHFQINHCDVFAVNRNHRERQMGETDYCGGCAGITVDLGGKVFVSDAFQQRLSLYDAEVSIAGEGVQIRCFISAVSDLLVLEVDDQREVPQPICLTVSMWREPVVKTGEHVAHYQFSEFEAGVCISQQFDEGDYHCASAVAAQVGNNNRYSVRPHGISDRAYVLVAPATNGKTTMLISSAASFSREADVGAAAVSMLKETADLSYNTHREAHTEWWHNFWSRTFVHIEDQNEGSREGQNGESHEGIAHFMARVRNLHLYNMAATSRGSLPPKWNGSLFITDGDKRQWGTQFWVWTTEMLYFPLFAADAIDLTEPYFSMYRAHLPDCKRAAQQRWGVAAGAFFPETSPFDGPTILPEDVAAEFQDVLLGRKPHTELSEHAYSQCQFDSHLRAATNPNIGRYTWISHVVSSGSEIALQAWWRYRTTGDSEWLRTTAYPLLRETVEFYRHFVEQGSDGLYHISGTNVHEDFWGVKDSIVDLGAIRGTAPLAIRGAEILGVDIELRAKWQELVDHLAPYPMGSDPGAKGLAGGVLADDAWAAGHLGDVDGQHNPADVWLYPIFPFETWTLETRHPTTDKIVEKTIALAHWMPSILNGAKLGTAIRTPIVWARAGRSDQLPALLGAYYTAFSPLPNGLSLFEGEQAHSAEHLGCITTALQEALLQSVAPSPGAAEVITVFPAWPKEWNASFRLLARGGFQVTSTVTDGEVQFINIESRLGETCQVRNPWQEPCVVSEVTADTQTQTYGDDLLRFDTVQGGRYRIRPEGKPIPTPLHISPSPALMPSSYSLELPNGVTHQGTLGRH